MNPARQLAFDLPHREALEREDYIVSRSNEAAVSAIDNWPDWPHSGLVLVGPPGSGKSHLAEVWRQRSGAVRVAAEDVRGDPQDLLESAPAIAIEDCDRGFDANAMFHLLDFAERRDLSVLLTSRVPPAEWPAELPDLMSRLSRLPVVAVAPPDDELLQCLLGKLFADRQLTVSPAVLRYMVVRMERSFAAARDIVHRLDRAAIETSRPVTRALAAQLLSETQTEFEWEQDVST